MLVSSKYHTIVIVKVIVIVIIIVVIVVMLTLILRDASGAERDLGLRRFPFTDAVKLCRVFVVACITFRSFVRHRAT